MRNYGSFVEFEVISWGLNENGEKVEYNYTVQTPIYSGMKKDQAKHCYNMMMWGDFKGTTPMHIEVDNDVFYHVGKRGGGTGKKVCRI